MNSTAAEDLLKQVIPVGHLRVALRVPRAEEDSQDRISFWWSVTSAAAALSEHLAQIGDLSGLRVVELGCGLGLPGITAGMLGARVLLTDYVPRAIEISGLNAELNGLDGNTMDFRILDWEDPGRLPVFDMVLGSEIVYDYFFHGALIRLLHRILTPDGRIVLADRKRLVVQRFVGRLINSGFSCTESRSRMKRRGFPDQEISIFTLKRVEAQDFT